MQSIELKRGRNLRCIIFCLFYLFLKYFEQIYFDVCRSIEIRMKKNTNSCCCQQQVLNLTDEESQDLALMFKALSHPVRIRIVCMLMKGECCVCDLHEGSGKGLPTISNHLKVLRHSKIIASTQRGQHVFYSLAKDCMPHICQCLLHKPTTNNQN